jgi:hypothetical protein
VPQNPSFQELTASHFELFDQWHMKNSRSKIPTIIAIALTIFTVGFAYIYYQISLKEQLEHKRLHAKSVLDELERFKQRKAIEISSDGSIYFNPQIESDSPKRQTIIIYFDFLNSHSHELIAQLRTQLGDLDSSSRPANKKQQISKTVLIGKLVPFSKKCNPTLPVNGADLSCDAAQIFYCVTSASQNQKTPESQATLNTINTLKMMLEITKDWATNPGDQTLNRNKLMQKFNLSESQFRTCKKSVEIQRLLNSNRDEWVALGGLMLPAIAIDGRRLYAIDKATLMGVFK